MTALAGIATACALFAPGAMAASQKFTVNNNTGLTLKLVRVDGDGNFEGRPNIGDLIAPGGSQSFEVQTRLFRSDQDYAYYQVVGWGDNSAYFEAGMNNSFGLGGGLAVSCSVPTGYACSPGSDWNWWQSNNDALSRTVDFGK